MIKKLLIPALSLLVLGSVSYGQASRSDMYKPGDRFALICPVGGEKLDLFEVAEKYINDKDNFTVVQKCCRFHKNGCRLHRTKNGDSLAHLAAYEGNTELLEKLINEEGFPGEGWQLTKRGLFLYRTQLMYAAEQGHLETVKMLVLKLGVNPDTKNKDDKTAADLAKAAGHTQIVKFFEDYKKGLYSQSINTVNKQNVVFAARDIEQGEYAGKDSGKSSI
jgi:hypothetical protein